MSSVVFPNCRAEGWLPESSKGRILAELSQFFQSEIPGFLGMLAITSISAI